MAQSHKVHQNGRPTKISQSEIQRELRKYFERGVCATTAHVKTGINIKTVCKYYDEWSEQIRESDSSDFLERQKNERSQIIVSFDEQILSVHRHLDDIEDQIKRYKNEGMKIPKNLFSLRLEMIKFLSSLIERKGLFTMQPLMDEGLVNKIKEMVKDNGKA